MFMAPLQRTIALRCRTSWLHLRSPCANLGVNRYRADNADTVITEVRPTRGDRKQTVVSHHARGLNCPREIVYEMSP